MEISKSLYESITSILLREFDENITWDKLGQKIISNYEKLTSDSNLGNLSDMEIELMKRKILNNVKAADPTPNQQYSLWLMTRLANNDSELQILLTARSTENQLIQIINQNLALFNTLKKNRKLSGSDSDINRYKTMDEVVEKVHEFGPEDFESGKSKRKDIAKEMQKQAELFISTPEYTVIIPKTEAASCYYGQGTKWCTAGTEGDNMFDSYSRQGDLYIIVPKSPRYDGEKFQVHFETNSYMDDQDREVDLNDLMNRFIEFFEKASELGKIKNSDYVIFVPQGILEVTVKEHNRLLDDYAFDIEYSAEQNDEEYAEFIRDHYGDEDGEVNWEQGYEDYPYEKYSPDFRNFKKLVETEYRFRSVDDLKSWIRNYSQYEEQPDKLYIGKFFKWTLNEKAIENRDGSLFIETLKKRMKDLSMKDSGTLY